MFTVAPPLLEIPLTVLPEKVSLVRLAVPLLFERPSPVLVEMVLFVRVKVPPLAIPPPATDAILPEMVQPVMVIVPLTLMTPPPLPVVELPVMAQAESISVPWLRRPPPSALFEFPLLTVNPDMLIVLPELIVKIPKFGVPLTVLRLTVSVFAPGPLIMRLPLMAGNAVKSVIVLLAGRLNPMVSSLAAKLVCSIAARSVHLLLMSAQMPSFKLASLVSPVSLTVRFKTGLTTCETEFELLVLNAPSPLYCAVIECGEPAELSAAVWHVATPLESVCVLVLPFEQVSGFMPSKNCAIPVGGPVTAVLEVTVAVKVTVWPVNDGFGEDESAVVVLDLLTVMLKVCEREVSTPPFAVPPLS